MQRSQISDIVRPCWHRGTTNPDDISATGRRAGTDHTTKRLLDVAVQVFAENGYDAARVNDIARRAGVTTGAVYARWHHKSDLMVAALEHRFDQMLPEHILKRSGEDTMRAPEMIAMLGATMLVNDDVRDVMVHAFGAARNNEAIRDCLQRYLREEADQVHALIELMKDSGFCDPDVSTAALSLLCHSVGIGSHLLITAGLDDKHIPSPEEWSALVWRFIDALKADDNTSD